MEKCFLSRIWEHFLLSKGGWNFISSFIYQGGGENKRHNVVKCADENGQKTNMHEYVVKVQKGGNRNK